MGCRGRLPVSRPARDRELAATSGSQPSVPRGFDHLAVPGRRPAQRQHDHRRAVPGHHRYRPGALFDLRVGVPGVPQCGRAAGPAGPGHRVSHRRRRGCAVGGGGRPLERSSRAVPDGRGAGHERRLAGVRRRTAAAHVGHVPRPSGGAARSSARDHRGLHGSDRRAAGVSCRSSDPRRQPPRADRRHPGAGHPAALLQRLRPADVAAPILAPARGRAAA